MSSKLQSDAFHFRVAPSGERLRNKRQAWCNLQVKLCDPCLSALCVLTWRYIIMNIAYTFSLCAVLCDRLLHCMLSLRFVDGLIKTAFWATIRKTVRPMLSDRCLSCLSVTLVYCGQTVGRIRMKLGMQVGLGPGHIVLNGDPALPPKSGTVAQFSAHVRCGQTAGWILGSCLLWPRSPISATAELLLPLIRHICLNKSVFMNGHGLSDVANYGRPV